jgi:hypothetical protein
MIASTDKVQQKTTHHHRDMCFAMRIRTIHTRIDPERFKPEHVGMWYVRECTDLLEEGTIVDWQDIRRQLDAWRTGQVLYLAQDSSCSSAE